MWVREITFCKSGGAIFLKKSSSRQKDVNQNCVIIGLNKI
jgi:hypothetical protein